MLFLPFIDQQWQVPKFKPYSHRKTLWVVLVFSVILILIANPQELSFILYTLLVVALPEEWFFRGYFMQRVELICNSKLRANIITSVFFAILHVPAQGVFGMSVFVPSLVLGWLYQLRQDMVLIILIHALSNLVYLLYFEKVFRNILYN